MSKNGSELHSYTQRPLPQIPSKSTDWYDSSNSTVHNEVIEALQQVSTPGEIAVALGLMIKNPSSYAFEDVLDVFSDWKADPLGMILNGVFSLIESGIGDDGELPIYQKTEGHSDSPSNWWIVILQQDNRHSV